MWKDLVYYASQTKIGDVFLNTCAVVDLLGYGRSLTLEKLDGKRQEQKKERLAGISSSKLTLKNVEHEMERVSRSKAAGAKLLGKTIRCLISHHQIVEMRWRSEVLTEDMKRSGGTKIISNDQKLMVVSK